MVRPSSPARRGQVGQRLSILEVHGHREMRVFVANIDDTHGFVTHEIPAASLRKVSVRDNPNLAPDLLCHSHHPPTLSEH